MYYSVKSSSSGHYRGFLFQSFEQNDFFIRLYRSVGEDVLHCIQDWVFYWWHCVSECVDVGRMRPTSAVIERR